MKKKNNKNIIIKYFTILCVSIIYVNIFANPSLVSANPNSPFVWASYASPQPSSVGANYVSPQPSSVGANYVSPYSYYNNGFYNYGGTQNAGGIAGTSAYFMIVNYDRIPYQIYNGEPMITRYPIIGGINYNMVAIANGLIPNAYRSIENWCRDFLAGKSYQDFFLNYASIENQTDVNITMIVHCALKKNAIIDGNMEFRLKLDLMNNRYNWERIGDTTNRKKIQIYDKDSIVIIE